MVNRRVKVTLPEHVAIAVRRLSDASGESMSAIIAGLLEPNVDRLLELADVLENAKVRRSRLIPDSRSVFRLAIDHICQEKARYAEQFSESKQEQRPRPFLVKSENITVKQAFDMGLTPLETHPYDPRAGSGIWFQSDDSEDPVFAVYGT